MNERPILFSSEMVRAILEGRKTQTRRLSGLESVNEKPDLWEFKKICALDYMTKKKYKGRYGAYFHSEKIEPRTLSICPVVFPYGEPGSRLWVRETFQVYQPSGSVGDEWIRDEIMEIDGRLPKEKPESLGYWWNIAYAADDSDAVSWWRPSIFMPRWASRINLEITNVRCERLQAITEADACAEGVEDLHIIFGNGPSYIDTYRELWNQLNARRGFGWNQNPWVWVIEFKTIDKIPF